MIKMFPQDMIQTYIVQHLSQGSRGPAPEALYRAILCLT